MAPVLRTGLIVYILVYIILRTMIGGLVYDLRPLAIPRTILELITQFLTFGPILFFPQRSIGWLHPLCLPAAVTIALSLAKGFGTLLTPFNFGYSYEYAYAALEDRSQLELGMILLKKEFILFMSTVAYLLTYFGLRRLPALKLRLRQPPSLSVRLFLGGLLGALAATYIILQNGGIQATIIGLASGRFRFREAVGGGHFIALTNILKYAWLIWYAYRPKAILSPFFWFYVFGSLATVFIVSGSRTATLSPLMLFGLVYVIHTRSIPLFTIGSVGVVIFAAVGILGQIRSAGNQGTEVDLTFIAEKSLVEHASATHEELAVRVSGTNLVLGKAMEEVGPLYGRTYLGAVFFFVPRALWKKKPRGAGAFAGNLLYYGKSFEGNEHGGDALGIPVIPEAEAYWNFWYFGVVGIGVLFGLFHRWLVNTFTQNRGQPVIWVIYLLGVGFTSLATASIVTFFQAFAMCLILAGLAYVWRPTIVYGTAR